ncbi:MAG: helix-turn-helix transcriptional regulator [Clostridia bacterium]|nr:helix-turn-helix transcriptional regulator [Clostridia bacterium]
MKLGVNLQYLRKIHGNMTQEELAERMSVSRQTISKWETGESHS